MAITTDSTQPGAGQLRTDSSSIDPKTAVRVPKRSTGGLVRDSAATILSGERAGTGRLRTLSSGSLHESITPDRQPAQSPDLMRKLAPAEFNTAMAHFYRGEVQRSNTWRTRLDTTTYWAVLLVSATLSFTFSSPLSPHFVIPIITILVTVFLVMEARRYRYYEIWASRVRVIETGYFAPMLAPDSVPRDQEWASHLASDLLTPHFTISVWEAIGRRLRRNYLWLFALLAFSWTLSNCSCNAPPSDCFRAGLFSLSDYFSTPRCFCLRWERFVCAKRPAKSCRVISFRCIHCSEYQAGLARHRLSRAPPCDAPGARANVCVSAPPVSSEKSTLPRPPSAGYMFPKLPTV
jgi:uncharacterized membrane protein